MMTVGQALFFAVLFGVILCIVAGLIFFNVGYKVGVQAQPVRPIIVTTYNRDTDEFEATQRFLDVYDAMTFVESQHSTHDVRVKVLKSNGEYVAVHLVRIAA